MRLLPLYFNQCTATFQLGAPISRSSENVYIIIIMQNTKKFEINILFIRVSLLLTSKECILLLHLLHAHAGRPVFLSLTLCFCGAVLDPRSFTEYILIPENTKYKICWVFMWSAICYMLEH